jgi:hypothetical protein
VTTSLSQDHGEAKRGPGSSSAAEHAISSGRHSNSARRHRSRSLRRRGRVQGRPERQSDSGRPVRSRLVWGFFCQVVVLGLLSVLCSERERPFFVPSPAIRVAERAEGVKGPKR